MSAEGDVLVGRYNSVIGNARTAFHREQVIEQTFRIGLEKLPGLDWFRTIIMTDQERYTFELSMATSEIRGEYVKHSFPILTDDFITDIVAVIQGLRVLNIVELCAGTGWLSHWLRIYGLEIEAAIDNKSWPGFEDRYLPDVEESDSAEYVEAHPEVDLFILSWPPYAGDIASRIWKSMRAGTYLLYIGESSGGCTGDDEFFNLLPGAICPETGRLNRRFISFDAIHDRPELYRKEA